MATEERERGRTQLQPAALVEERTKKAAMRGKQEENMMEDNVLALSSLLTPTREEKEGIKGQLLHGWPTICASQQLEWV